MSFLTYLLYNFFIYGFKQFDKYNENWCRKPVEIYKDHTYEL